MRYSAAGISVLQSVCEGVTLSVGCVCAGDLCAEGVEDVFVFCTRAELVRYRVPCLLERYAERGLCVHHLPFPDGGAPELAQCCRILEELQLSLQNQRRTLIQ